MADKSENVQLKSRLEEIKLIDRAKCVLMQCLAMSEPQAHKFIERQAMDLRISKKRVAEQVLNTYEIQLFNLSTSEKGID